MKNRTSFSIHSVLELLSEQDVGELAEPVRNPGAVGARLACIKIRPVHRPGEQVGGTRDGDHASFGALEQTRQ